MKCESMVFVTNHTPYLWGLSKSFSNSFIEFYSFEVISSSDMSEHEASSFDRLASIKAIVLKLWIYFLWCLTWGTIECAVCVLESAQYGLEIIFNPFTPRLIFFLIIWPAPRASKTNQILRCDWLPERARWSYLARSGLPAASRKKNFPASHIINITDNPYLLIS